MSTCSSSECLLECSRAMGVCTECKYLFQALSVVYHVYNISSISACPCHTDCIDGCKGCDNPICFCNVSKNYKIYTSLLVFKDDSNADNQKACLDKTSKTLGQCILDCKDDSTCETTCVSTFKSEHSECPCQVGGVDLNLRFLS